MKKIVPWIILCAFCMMLCGCGQTPDMLSEESEPLPLSTMLTAQQVGDATGFTVGEPQMVGEDAVAYFSNDHTASVYLSVKKMSEDEFLALMDMYISNGQTVTEAPNLAERAAWFAEDMQLVAYAGGYGTEVHVDYATPRPNDSLLAARQLATLVFEQLLTAPVETMEKAVA